MARSRGEPAFIEFWRFLDFCNANKGFEFPCLGVLIIGITNKKKCSYQGLKFSHNILCKNLYSSLIIHVKMLICAMYVTNSYHLIYGAIHG